MASTWVAIRSIRFHTSHIDPSFNPTGHIYLSHPTAGHGCFNRDGTQWRYHDDFYWLAGDAMQYHMANACNELLLSPVVWGAAEPEPLGLTVEGVQLLTACLVALAAVLLGRLI